jgi:hypothetical protein
VAIASNAVTPIQPPSAAQAQGDVLPTKIDADQVKVHLQVIRDGE